MKKTLNLIVMTLCVLFSHAQLPVPAQTDFSRSLQKIFFDFPNNFRNIQGELYIDEAEYEKYVSTISLPGVQDCMITHYHSVVDSTSSWQGLVIESDDYEEATAKYASLCQQIKLSSISLTDGSSLYLEGKFEAAKEANKFTTSTYRLATPNESFKNVKIEVELLAQVTQWRVVVNVFSKRSDDLASE